MSSSRILALCALTVTMAATLQAGSTMAKVTGVVSSNTITVELRGKQTTIRLHGVASPDPNDARPLLKQLGQEAKVFLEDFLASKWVMVEFPSGDPKPDPNGVVDGFVYVTDRNQTAFVNEKLVAEGLGIVNRKTPNIYTTSLIGVETKAKASRKGIWSSFENGGGKQIAQGNQPTYIGVGGGGAKTSSVEYVEVWIVSYW